MTTSEPRLTEDLSGVEELPSNSGWIRVTVEIAIAVLILIGIYYLLAPEEDVKLPPLPPQEIDPIIRAQIEEAKQPGQTPAAATETTPPPASSDTGSPMPKAEDSPAAEKLPEGTAARQLIASLRKGSTSLTESEVLSRANQFQQQGATSDAYLLLFYAARQGGGQAAFDLATLYDPNHFSEGSNLLQEPDAYQAHKWYSKAAGLNIPQAESRLKTLRETILKRAEKGDMDARRLLLNWR